MIKIILKVWIDSENRVLLLEVSIKIVQRNFIDFQELLIENVETFVNSSGIILVIINGKIQHSIYFDEGVDFFRVVYNIKKIHILLIKANFQQKRVVG